jgi:hypothetical protein
MKTIFGIKGKMTQHFQPDGRVSAATIIEAKPMTVTQVKTAEVDGYQAVQVGIGERKAKNLSKQVLGHLKDIAPVRYIREIRTTDTAERGAAIDISVFAPGDVVEVSAISMASTAVLARTVRRTRSAHQEVSVVQVVAQVVALQKASAWQDAWAVIASRSKTSRSSR